MKLGTFVYWCDPDAGTCSGAGCIVDIHGDTIAVQKGDGGLVEAYPHELRTKASLRTEFRRL